MSITSVTATPLSTANTAGSATAAAAASATNSAGSIQDSFIKLLVAQIENQDPTKPLSSSDMTSQMSQLNVVSGINQLNTTLSSLLSNVKTSDAVQAATLIGHSVLVPGNSVQLMNGSAKMGLQLGQAADDVKINILDSTGNVISTQDLGAKAAGLENLSWDGTTSAGAVATNPPYTFNVTATLGGKSLPETAIQPLEQVTVNNVSMAGGVTSLNVKSSENTMTNVALSDVYQVTN